MKSRKRTTLIILAGAAFFLLGTFYLLIEGFLIAAFEDKYGRNYNLERLKLGQPIIEEYFVEKEVENRLMHWWTVSGAYPPVGHMSKNYETNAFGALISETDYYIFEPDTSWLIRKLRELERDVDMGDQITECSLFRSYLFSGMRQALAGDSIYYQVIVKVDNRREIFPISRSEGDSIHYSIDYK